MSEPSAAPVPFFSDQGHGDPVVCLQSNASSSSQWRPLASLLAERFRVIAVDGYGAGKSPDWPAAMPARFDEEVRLLDAVFANAGGPVRLVGHSYGAAVAMQAAIRFPDRVRSMVAYEPTLFSLLACSDPEHSPVAGIWRAAGDAAAAVERGDNSTAHRSRVSVTWVRSLIPTASMRRSRPFCICPEERARPRSGVRTSGTARSAG